MSTPLRVGSLFSGVGGFDLGFERAGMTVAWQCEIDLRARAVLTRHWPEVPCYEDVKDVNATAPAVDVLCGGFPCQDLSVAGKRAGLAGERSGLFHAFARVIEQVRPGVVVIENVPGLLSSNGGRDMATVVGTLGELGYGWAYRVLDAQYFGLAQRRQRVFIVGCAGGDTGRAAAILFEPESVRRDSPPSRTAGQGVAGTVGGSSQSGGFRTTDLDNNGAYVIQERAVSENLNAGPQGKGWQEEIAFTLEARQQAQIVASPLTGEGAAEGAWRGDGSDNIVFEPRYVRNGRGAPDKPSPTLHAGEPMMLTVGTLRGSHNPGATDATDAIVATDTLAGTVGARDFKGAGSYRDGGIQNCAMVAGRVRRLMPVEYARLQGFPDDWNDWLPDSARYKQMGNAVAVPVAEWIGRRIVAALQ